MKSSRFIKHFLFLIFFNVWLSDANAADTLWFHKIDLTRFTQDWNLTPKAYLALQEKPMAIRGQQFKNGLASRTEGLLRFALNGKAEKFYTLFALDDSSNKNCKAVLSAFADGKEVFKSPVITNGSKPLEINIDLKGIKQLELVIDNNGTGLYADRANYANAFITYTGPTPEVLNYNYINKRYILTPPVSAHPKINSAKVFGVRPGNPFMYTIAATGERPMNFTAKKLPKGLSLDSKTGIITGVLKEKGEHKVRLKATNKLGSATRELKIVVGDKIALTPPMGWNGYNRYGDSINQVTVTATVDAMVSSGLINHGWNYINIDDAWSIHSVSKEPLRVGEPRDANGMINANKKFPDMKAMTDYIHAKGFKAGIYCSPDYVTCTGYTASYGYEEQDARRWAEWGFDYLKYDYCGYNKRVDSETIANLQKPFIVMRKALDKVNRDIVFSFSQYGVGDSWEWAPKIGANSWRTTGDLIDTWASVSEIGFPQAGLEKYAGPGHWNDPDMLVVGNVGWGETKYPSRLTADEQYSHISLWSLLASPLLIGCDITDMDDFTKNLFTNDEVIEINQDPLGKQAGRVFQENGLEIWSKKMEDGSIAVGLFNRNSTTETINASWDILGLKGKQKVRDVWRQKDEGIFKESFSAVVPAHGVKLIRIKK